MSDRKPSLGFIGLGIMGRPMAENLLAAGYDLTVYNRTKAKMDPLVAKGAAAASSPADAAENAEVIITIVGDSPDVREVVAGPEGILRRAQPGSTVIDMTTIAPAVARDVARSAEEKGVAMLDAPVSGGDTGAIAATLSIMIGGPRESFESCRPIFEVLGENIVYMGESGNGQATKLCNQILCGLNLLAVSEALTLGSQSGLDLERLIRAISGGAAGSWMLRNLGPKMAARDFAPGFMVRLQQKDLRLVLEAARELDVPLPGTGLVHQLFAAVEAEGLGYEGTQALIRTLEKLADIRVEG